MESKLISESASQAAERFAKFFYANPCPMCVTRMRDGCFLDVNDSFARFIGYTRADLLGHTSLEVNFWPRAQARAQVVETLIQQRAIRDLEITLRARGGQLYVMLLSAEIIAIDDEPCALATLTDVTAQRRRERIRAATHRIAEAVDSADNLQALFRSVHEITGELMAANNFYIALRDAATGEISFPYFVDELEAPPAPRQSRRGLTEYVMRTGAMLHAPLEVIETLAQAGEIELLGAPALDWLGAPLKIRDQIIGALVMQSYTHSGVFDQDAQDMLVFVSAQAALAIERKRAEQELRQSSQRYEDLVNHVEGIVWEADAQTFRFTFVSSQAERLLGYPLERWLNEPDFWQAHIHADDREWAVNFCVAATRERRDHDFEYRMLAADGRVVWLRDIVSVVVENEQTVKLRGVMVDITSHRASEAALRASEEKYRELVENINDIVFATDEQGMITYISPVIERLSGISVADILGRSFSEFVHPEDLPMLRESFQRTMSGQIEPLEFRGISNTGDVRWLRSSSRTHLVGEAAVGLRGVITDITERKQAEAERAEFLAREKAARIEAEHIGRLYAGLYDREQSARTEAETARREWQTTFDTMADYVVLADCEDRLVRANRAFYEGLRLNPEEGVGRSLTELLHAGKEHFSVARLCPVCELRRKGERAIIELPKDVVSPYPVAVSIDPITDEAGNITGIIQVIRNQSELYHAREQAERERVSLNATIEQMAEGLIVWDENNAIIRANRRAHEMLGFALDRERVEIARALTDGRFSDATGQQIAPEDLPVQRALREQRIVESQFWYTRPDRNRLLLSITASPFFNEQDRLAGAVALIRDVTQQQREHERVQQADKLRALGQLASGVAHNFNNALAAVIGYTQLALPKVKDPDIEKYLRVVEQSAKDAARMVERIQNFSRGRSRADEFQPVRVGDIVRDAIDITRPRWRHDAEALGIKYEVKLGWEGEAEALVKGEASELREVCVNIIFNALDAMPLGGRLEIEAASDAQNVRLSFRDTGGGMTEEIKRRVFEPFFTTKGAAGLGMGLSESYRIVERHGGRIEVESQLRRGTSFIITLPLAQAQKPEADQLEGWSPTRSAQVLVIDDEEFVRNVLAAMLVNQGYQVVNAGSAEEALQLIERYEFDVVFTDLAMPKVDGIAAATEIKAHRPQTRIVLMSGYGSDSARTRAAEADCIDAIISKPFRMDEIQRALKELLQ